MNINYNALFKFFIPYFLVVLVAYILTSILYFILPNKVQNIDTLHDNTLEYTRYNVYNAFVQQKKVVKKEVVKPVKQEYSLLTNIELIAIYAFSNENGYIILKEKNKSETLVLSSDESFKDYLLTKVYQNYVIFTKNNKEYKVSMGVNKNDVKFDIVSQDDTIKTTQSISLDNNMVTVKRDLIDDYIKNFDKIWNDIAISEVKTSSGIDGFRVNRIKKNTPFSKIGLKKGDIIKQINNTKLKSYNDAFKLYKKIDKIKSLNLVLMRNNIEMEIYYEIK
jgi:type II secretion system protein C